MVASKDGYLRQPSEEETIEHLQTVTLSFPRSVKAINVRLEKTSLGRHHLVVELFPPLKLSK